MCGIFGCINKNKEYFNKASFNLLGIANDSRGGDSCGVFIDGKYKIGVKENKLYGNFFDDNEVLKSSNFVQIALGHCRKASVGVVSEETAQPVVIKNSNDEIEFIVIHNGTIHNWKELAAKYLKETPDHFTDSYVMAHIFYTKGYDVLKEYIGAAAFVIIDYRKDNKKPTTYMFKGESLLNQHATVTSEERPLFVSIEGSNYWFSSMLNALKAARYDASQFCTLLENSLIEIKDGKMEVIKVYDRSKQTQTMPYNVISNVYKSTFIQNSTKYFSTFSEFCKSIMLGKTYLNGRVCMNEDGYYRFKNELINGGHSISPYGYIYENEHYVETYPKKWFFVGNLVYNEEAFTSLTLLAQQFQLKDSELSDYFPEIIAYFSPIPILYTGSIITCINIPYIQKATGDFYIPYSADNCIIKIKKGKFKSGKIIQHQDAIKFEGELKEKNKQFTVTEDDYEKIYKYIKTVLEEE